MKPIRRIFVYFSPLACDSETMGNNTSVIGAAAKYAILPNTETAEYKPDSIPGKKCLTRTTSVVKIEVKDRMFIKVGMVNFISSDFLR
jgi:hypothetical protein